MDPKDPRELLSLLTAKVQRFQAAPGGIPLVTQEDLAHILGMIHSAEARLLARVKYALQLDYAESLACAVRRHALMMKDANSWRSPRPDFLLDLGFMLVAESVDDHRCPWCKGVGELKLENGKVIKCEACGGTTVIKLRESDRAKLLNIPKSSWSERWSKRYRDIQIETLDKWDELIRGAIGKRLFP